MPSYSRWISKFEIKPDSWVFVPSTKSIQIGLSIKSQIQSRWLTPLNYFHLKKGGHISALRCHLNNTTFVHLDIKNFFGSINRSRVTRSLKKYFGYQKARSIAMESTVKTQFNGESIFVLPFGFVQSPLIASLCFYESHLGQYLQKLFSTKSISVSIYMDDIIISSQHHSTCKKTLKNIKIATKKSKFNLNPDKEEGPANRITAFNINFEHKKMAIHDEKFYELLKVYNNSTNQFQKDGIKSYVASVNNSQATYFK